MRSGWRVVGVVLALLAAFFRRPAAGGGAAGRHRCGGRAEQLKKDVKEERFETAERKLEEWRKASLEKTTGKPLLDDKASMEDLQKEFNAALDAKQYGVAQYYLEQIRTQGRGAEASSRRPST